MIEFLLTVPLLLLILFLIVSFGKGWRLKQRAVVASRHATWQKAWTGQVGPVEDFQRDFFSGDETGGHGGRSGDSGKGTFTSRLNLPGVIDAFWRDRYPRLSGVTVQRAAVDYVPPGEVYRYTLQRIGETTSRETQFWQWEKVNFWRFFGERIMEEATDRRPDVLDAFDQAGQQGLSTVSDPVLYDNLVSDMSQHRRRMDSHYGGWIGSWRRG